MVRAWHGRGIASVNQTRPHCVNQKGKTHYKPLAARHGRGTAWARHAMCESAFTVSKRQSLCRTKKQISGMSPLKGLRRDYSSEMRYEPDSCGRQKLCSGYYSKSYSALGLMEECF
jgi:hypothetical protein